MSRIESFKRALSEKRAVKIIAGIDNFDVENVKKVVMAASNSGASAIDICADTDIIAMVRQMTDLPLFVSSVVPQELAHAVILGADAVELGNFDALYKKGQTFTASQVLELAKETKELIGNDVFFCVTIPGELEIAEQIENMLCSLTGRQREAIYLRYMQELEYDEIAVLLNLTTKGTRKLIYRAIERMREQYGPVLFYFFLSDHFFSF